MSVQQCAPQTETGVTSREEVNVLKRNSDDVGWEYGFLVDANNKDKVECKFYCRDILQTLGSPGLCSSFVVESSLLSCQ